MQILIDNRYNGLSALHEAANLAKLGFPTPADFPLANSLSNPLGPRPARAIILMQRSDVTEVSQNAYHTMRWEDGIDGGVGNQITFHNLIFITARCLTPGKTNDPDSSM